MAFSMPQLQCRLSAALKNVSTAGRPSTSGAACLPPRPLLQPARQPQRLVCMAAAEETAEAAADRKQRKPRPEMTAADWTRAVELQSSGVVVEGRVVGVNRSGALLDIGLAQPGFMPYRLMDRARVAAVQERDEATGAWKGAPPEGYTGLKGQLVEVKVTQVIVPERRLIVSEKAALLDRLTERLAVGEVVEGRVSSLHDFGAFIEAASGEGAGAEVMLPLREVSWDWVPSVNAVLAKGQPVRVVVVQITPPPRSKVVVSLKRMQEDPLRETLDRVLPPQAEGEAPSSVPASMPSGVEDILDELAKEAGVSSVALGRRAEERRTVSQDLELWISKEVVAGGYNLLARAGRVVQEIHVETGLEPGEMKAAVQRVLKRLV